MGIIKSNKRFILLVNVLTAILYTSCVNKPTGGMVVFTEIPSNQFSYDVWDLSKFEGAHILAISPEGKENTPLNLTEEFHSACSPHISYDGEKLLFAAKKNAGDTWQIWEMKLSNRKTRQITSFDGDCISPDYLPVKRFVFSRKLTGDKVKSNYAVFTGNLDGTNISQITFDPRSHGALKVINDGRILTVSKQEYPEKGQNKFMVMRPDGTKLELFYKSDPVEKIAGPAAEVGGEIWFAETDSLQRGQLISLDYNLPLHTKKVVSEGLSVEFAGISGYGDGQLLATYRSANTGEFSLGLFNPSGGKLSEIYSHAGFSIVEAALVQAWQRPKNLPSEVQMQENTGLLMCQDINFAGTLEESGITKADKIEVLGIDTALATVQVEEDGSFYIKIEADAPFRIQAVSKDGSVISGPGDWYYLRPNERRACAGCHTGTEISPFNRQPLAVKKNPVMIKVNEKLEITADGKDYEHD